MWQAGSYLLEERGAKVHDWSWRRTRRRIGLLVRLARPYGLQDGGRRGHAARLHRRRPRSALSRQARRRRGGSRRGISTGSRRSSCSSSLRDRRARPLLRPDVPDGWSRPSSPTLRERLFTHLQRLSLGYYERNRTNCDRQPDHERRGGARPTRSPTVLTSLVQNTISSAPRWCCSSMAPRPRDAPRDSADGARHRAWFRVRSNRAYRPCAREAARARHGDAGRGHRGHARRPVVHP